MPSVIVVGAKGRFGRAAIKAFRDEGWTVRAFARNWPTGVTGGEGERIEGDAFDAAALTKACEGCDVIVNALNPPYEKWRTDLPRLTKSVIEAAKKSGATVMIPGNVYNYGADMPPVLVEQTPHGAKTRKGVLRMEMEKAYKAASRQGVRTVILRGGDFIEKAKTGNWFDTYITPKVNAGKITYPGPLDKTHAWAYLPDMARAMAQLAAKRQDLAPFEEFVFEGYNLTGAQLVSAIEQATGKTMKVSGLPWPMVSILGWFKPQISEVIELRYLWGTAHALDGTKLAKTLPDFKPTAVEQALKTSLEL